MLLHCKIHPYKVSEIRRAQDHRHKEIMLDNVRIVHIDSRRYLPSTSMKSSGCVISREHFITDACAVPNMDDTADVNL